MRTHTGILITDGFSVQFNVSRTRIPKTVDVVLELHVNPDVAQIVLKSKPTLMRISDCQRLVDYFDNHIKTLRDGSLDHDSDLFTTYEYGFHIRALSGDIGSVGDEENITFGLQILLNIGGNDETGAVFMGCESSVDALRINAFESSFVTALGELDMSW